MRTRRTNRLRMRPSAACEPVCGIGARLLREYAYRIGLDPAFTIHDREDSGDLMKVVRHELGFSTMESRFPTKGTCLAVYSRCINAELAIEEVVGTTFPWSSAWETELKELFAAYIEAKQHQNVLDYDDLLLYWAYTLHDPGLANDIGGRFERVLVDEIRTRTGFRPRSSWRLVKPGRPLTDRSDSPLQATPSPTETEALSGFLILEHTLFPDALKMFGADLDRDRRAGLSSSDD
jgi:hypothetical protein